MENIYAQSYCNISATAAEDSTAGLFRERDVGAKWVDAVTLNTKDLVRDSAAKIECTVFDLSFWSKYVDDAPVNRRSWVYQERLLAPRVLHWCKNQIAFECRQVNRAECRPEGLPHYIMKQGVLIDGVRLKTVDVEASKQLMAIRLLAKQPSSQRKKVQTLVNNVEPHLQLYELWKHWVEVYTKMELTKEQDRLIALSGIARLMTDTMKSAGIVDRYIAGLWQKHLASQLLWYVNEGTGLDRQPCVNTRPTKYRAPTFSWASVETSRGITFPETTDKGLIVSVEVTRLTYLTAKDRFGLLTDGYVVLRGVLRKIEIYDRATPDRPPATRLEAAVSEHTPLKIQTLTILADTKVRLGPLPHAVPNIMSPPAATPPHALATCRLHLDTRPRSVLDHKSSPSSWRPVLPEPRATTTDRLGRRAEPNRPPHRQPLRLAPHLEQDAHRRLLHHGLARQPSILPLNIRHPGPGVLHARLARGAVLDLPPAAGAGRRIRHAVPARRPDESALVPRGPHA
jgi:hypothetical protein